MKKPLVTVITVTSNLIKNERENLFRQCITSVYNQTYNNIEHLIIDNASDDGTQILLNEYEKNGYCRVVSEPDNGIYDAMNKGINKSKGEYIIFLNSDDYFNNMNAIKNLTEAIINSNNDFACAYAMATDKTNFIPFYTLLDSFFQTMPFAHQSMLIKKTILNDLDGFDTNFKLGADLDLIIRLILAGHIPSIVQDFVVNCNIGEKYSKNYDKVIDEYARIFMKNYKCFYDLKYEDGIKLAKFEKVPSQFYNNLYAYLKIVNPYFYEQLKNRKFHIKFLGLPLLKIKQDISNLKIYLFGIIPLFRLKNSINKMKIFIFSIPIIKIKKSLEKSF